MLISVVIPAYNQRDLLPRALRSVRSQTYQEWECIVVDDASEDGTSTVVEQMADPRFTLVQNKRNLGPGASRNRGIAVARGEVIAFLDSDDEWLPEKLARYSEALLEPASKHSAVVGSVQRHYLNGTVEDTVITSDAIAFPRLFAMPVIGAGSSMMVRRTALEAVGSFDEQLRYFEDWDLVLRLASRGAIAIIDEPLHRKYATGTPGNIQALDRSRRHFLKKHQSEIAQYPPRIRRRTVAQHHLQLARTALVGHAWPRAVFHGTAAVGWYPRFVVSVAKSIPLVWHGRQTGSTNPRVQGEDR